VTIVAQPSVDGRVEPGSLVCSACGYGIVRRVPPELCPMCGEHDGWALSSWQPFGRTADDTRGVAG